MNAEIIKFARKIDHTILKPNACDKQIAILCEEAINWEFASVCINPQFVPLASAILRGSSPAVCTVIGFPLGANKISTKIAEADEAMSDGASELDIVVNLSAYFSGHKGVVSKEIQTISEMAHLNGAIVKTIIETCLLTDEQKVELCQISLESGADFVKTSTGFSTGGATIEDIKLMRKIAGEKMLVKASGGIRTYEFAKALVDAGADRIGASASVEIMKSLSALNSKGEA